MSDINKIATQLNNAAEEGDLRENTAYQTLRNKQEELATIQSHLTEEKLQTMRLSVEWESPSEVDGKTILMGTKIFLVGKSTPVVIVPRGEIFRTLREKEKEYGVKFCSTASPFSTRYLGQKVEDVKEIARVERISIHE